MKNRISFVLCVLGLALFMGAAAHAADRKFAIGAVVADFKTPFQARLKLALERYAKEMGVDIDVRDGKSDPTTQTAVIENFITQKKDFLIIVPAQVGTLVPAVLKCNDVGIPVITINRTLGEGAKVLTHVGADEYIGGQMQGEMLVAMLGQKGNIVLEQGTLGSSPQVLREQGMEDYLKEKAPGIKIVAKQNTDWDPAKAVNVTQNFLTKYPAGQIDGIVTQGPDCSMAAARVVEMEGRSELKGKNIGFDLPQGVIDGIKDGSLFGSVLQDPAEQSRMALVVAMSVLNGEKKLEDIPENTYIQLINITKANVDNYEAAW